MILVIGGIKGGSGKSTVATNLAVMRAAAGRDVLLVDADDQETASDFTLLRHERRGEAGAGYTSVKLTGPAVRTEGLRLAAKYQDLIIDTGGRDTTSQRAALAIADVLLVPFVPRSFDVWTLEKVAALVGEMRAANPALRAYVFLNRADPRGQENEEAAAQLRAGGGDEADGSAANDHAHLTFLATPLGTRKAFGNAAAEGLAVNELRSPDPKASEEIGRLYQRVFNVGTTSA